MCDTACNILFLMAKGGPRNGSTLDAYKLAPKGAQAMLELQKYIDTCGLDHSLMELVKTRASQINGCAFCIDMHTKNARALGETEQRLYALNAWRETSFFSDREQAALEWAEAVTLVAESHVPDEIYQRAKQQFTPEELVQLTLAIATINSWNRLSVAFRQCRAVTRRTGSISRRERDRVQIVSTPWYWKWQDLRNFRTANHLRHAHHGCVREMVFAGACCVSESRLGI